MEFFVSLQKTSEVYIDYLLKFSLFVHYKFVSFMKADLFPILFHFSSNALQSVQVIRSGSLYGLQKTEYSTTAKKKQRTVDSFTVRENPEKLGET